MDEVIQFEPLNYSIIYHGISICHYQSAKQKTNANYAHKDIGALCDSTPLAV